MSVDLTINNDASTNVNSGERSESELGRPTESQAGSRRFNECSFYRPFPVECLPECVRDFVVANAQAMGCDESFLALPALTVMAGAIDVFQPVT